MTRRVGAWACCAALPALASAAQWTVVPQLALTADTDSNRRLQIPPHASEGAVLGGALAIARLTEVSQLALTPRGSISRYSGEDALDSEDWGVSALWHRNGERLVFDVQAGYSDDSTLTTEPGETGFVEGNTRRHAKSASAALTQYLATRHMLQYQLGTSDIDYEEARGTGLIGYRYPSAALTYVFSATPRLETTFMLSAARLTAGAVQIESETHSAQVGIRLQISERFELDAAVGRSTTRAHGVSDSDQNYRAGISWHDELSRLEFSASRAVEPSGRGVLVNADDLRVAYSRQLTERWSLDSSLRLSRREDFDFTLRQNDYFYGAAVLGVSMKLDESWTVGIAGAYSRQEYELAEEYADGRRVGLSVTWRPLQ